MKIIRNCSASDLRNETWECDDFWSIIKDQHLESKIDAYFDDCYDELTIVSFNDVIRFDGGEILREIGADLTDTIFETDDEKYERMNDDLAEWMENHSNLIKACADSNEWEPIIAEMHNVNSDIVDYFGESDVIDVAKSYSV